MYALDGGPTLNPSTYDLLAGIHAVPAEAVVVLPNSTNVVMAAERAADLSEKDVRVVLTESQQAGLVAAVALDPTAPLDRNASAMSAAVEAIRTGGVAPAARDDAQGRFAVGDAVGYVGSELVAWGDPETALRTVIGVLAHDAELVTPHGRGRAPRRRRRRRDGAGRRGAGDRGRRPAELVVAARGGVTA